MAGRSRIRLVLRDGTIQLLRPLPFHRGRLMSRICPGCEEYGDVWEVSFTNLNGRRGIMCIECDTVWDSLCEDQVPSHTNFESLMKENGIIPDWSQIAMLQQVLP